MSDTIPTLNGGNASANSTADTNSAAKAFRAGVLWATRTSRKPEAAALSILASLIRRAGALCLVATSAIVALTACGRGPVEPPPPSSLVPTIQFQIYVAGQINPTSGNYIVAINANTTPTTNVNASFGEAPGQPTAQEGQGTPATFTHWDQAFRYGSSTLSYPNGFTYSYKVLVGSAGTTTANFFPIILNANNYTLIPNASAGTGSGNVLSMTIPISILSIRANEAAPNPPTISSPPVTQIYVNFITTDTSNVPQDQLGANGLGTIGYTQIVNLTSSQTLILPNFSSAPPPPNGNPNLFITGGQIIVSIPAGASAP